MFLQMRRLRSDKAELEDRIRDLEARLSEQAVCIREMERRQRMERERADDAEMRLGETDTVAAAAAYPIVVPRDGITARWIFTSAPKVGRVGAKHTTQRPATTSHSATAVQAMAFWHYHTSDVGTWQNSRVLNHYDVNAMHDIFALFYHLIFFHRAVLQAYVGTKASQPLCPKLKLISEVGRISLLLRR